MGHQNESDATNKASDQSDVTKPGQTKPTKKSALSDEQMSKISGGGGFPTMEGSGDTSITPTATPIDPNQGPTMP